MSPLIIKSDNFSTLTGKKAFYIFTDGPFLLGDWVVAYNNEVVIGSSEFQGYPFTLPLMGYDGALTQGYATYNSDITVNIHRNGGVIEYTDTMLPTWQSTKIFSIE